MKRSEEELEQQLQQWYQQSRQQNAMPEAVKKQLTAQIAATSQPISGWQRLIPWMLQLLSWRNIQALTAVVALGVGWQLLHQQHTYYQISQTLDVYPVQVHQLTTQEAAGLPTAVTAATVQRQALFQQKYQDYLQASANHKTQRQLIVSRQFSDEDGWHLDICQQMQLQLTSEWLAEFKLQRQWTEPQWQQLQASEWLQVTTGAEGQILALQRSEQPPNCAP
ncbi:hypothetical protein EOE67_05945 [Rheinheimera riviphila]|uniref:Uncharacterized protein n=1 Tax=Rheinheimera riviphila TaxID=1834037 RepID=A0A437R1H8_9GAMM|nr:hypothetical protein [Rheinheimera riviphila]RVU40583.1 hypothetical protein EOE67_05945 [Rheinheimera riviphila]